MFAAIAERIEQAKPRIVVFCGRGSSGHVGVYLRYLFEARLGLLASAAAPSVVTAYQRPPDMRDALFVVVSQSGRSPDIVTATEVARKSGALTLAIVNDENSPAACRVRAGAADRRGNRTLRRGDQVGRAVDDRRGAAGVALARDNDLSDCVRHLPVRLSGALACDWSAWADSAAQRRRPLSSGADTASVAPARSRSSGRNPAGPGSRLQRGRAAARAARIDHAGNARAGAATERSGRRRRRRPRPRPGRRGRDGLYRRRPGGTLPWIGDGHPVCDPVVMLVPAYRAIEAAARRRGFDPDNPPHLSKVTRTL
jgi:glucosamine--fructose-6-phosphate aminotransferase (isomerizing)